MPNTKIFSHESLNYKSDQIRLLRIKNTENETIECELTNYDPASRPPYTALSYTWEPAYPEREILVNGRPFIVGNNLWQFLSTIRHTDEIDLYYWIDQICINQTNIPEKNHQVGIMSTIYNQARDMVIWLGPECDGSGLAVDFIQHFAYPSEYVMDLHDPLWFQKLSKNQDSELKLAAEVAPDAQTEAGLTALFHRRYWERLWVIQEIMYAREIRVKCGDRTFGWERFYMIDRWIWRTVREGGYNRSSMFPVHFSELLGTKERDWGLGLSWHLPKNQRLSDILWRYQIFECGNVHDKVYGLLRLTTAGENVHVDYSQSHFSLWLQVARYLLPQSDLDSTSTFLFFWYHLSLDFRTFHPFRSYLQGLQSLGLSNDRIIDYTLEIACTEKDIDWEAGSACVRRLLFLEYKKRARVLCDKHKRRIQITHQSRKKITIFERRRGRIWYGSYNGGYASSDKEWWNNNGVLNNDGEWMDQRFQHEVRRQIELLWVGQKSQYVQ